VKEVDLHVPLLGRIVPALAFITAAVLISGGPGRAHSKGLYDTAAKAQERAEQIGCDTIHRNNGRWMPCRDERQLHQQLRKQR